MVEIIKPKNTLLENLSKRPAILWGSLIFLGAVVLIYAGLYFYSLSIQNEITSLNGRIAQAQSKIKSQDSVNVINFINQSDLIKQALIAHNYFSSFFGILESLVNQKVSLAKITIDAQKNFVDIEGLAQNYTYLAKEIVALRSNQKVIGVDVSQISLTPRGLNFRLLANVNNEIFKVPSFTISTSTPPTSVIISTTTPSTPLTPRR